MVKSEESKPFKPFSEFSITKGHNHVQTGLKQSEVSFIMNIIGAFRDQSRTSNVEYIETLMLSLHEWRRGGRL